MPICRIQRCGIIVVIHLINENTLKGGMDMKLVKRKNTLFPQIPSLFDDYLGRDLSDWLNTNFPERDHSIPAVNIKESDREFTLELAAPGMDKKDFNIELEDNVLTISSEKKNEVEETDKKGNYFRKEFNYQSFQRSFRVQEDLVNVDKIQANYQNGLLIVKLPKQDVTVTRPSRQIKIT
jgi:HSP20 family protein